jgi:hypothetical protein
MLLCILKYQNNAHRFVIPLPDEASVAKCNYLYGLLIAFKIPVELIRMSGCNAAALC